MRYLLDTTVFIDVSRGQAAVTDWLFSLVEEPDVLVTSAVVVAEYFSGIPVNKRDQAKEFLEVFDVLPVTFEDAAHAGRIRWEYARKGISLAIADVIIGATALERGFVLATSNPAHFPFVQTFDPRSYKAQSKQR